jgi:hypothetical protein
MPKTKKKTKSEDDLEEKIEVAVAEAEAKAEAKVKAKPKRKPSAYNEFVRMHYHDKEVLALPPKERLRQDALS